MIHTIMSTWLVVTFTNFTFNIIKNIILTILISVKCDAIYYKIVVAKIVVRVDIVVNAIVKTRSSI
jgi:hypothetical protein